MNAEIKQQWVVALRSGQYKQGRGKLRRQTPEGDRYCCLGVLCDLLAADKWTVYDGEEYFAIDGFVAFPPKELRARAGFDGKIENQLVMLNDAEGYGFHQIADWIEANA
jgi:hypothetical protein